MIPSPQRSPLLYRNGSFAVLQRKHVQASIIQVLEQRPMNSSAARDDSIRAQEAAYQVRHVSEAFCATLRHFHRTVCNAKCLQLEIES